MKITLIDYTGIFADDPNLWAMWKLAFVKSTRLMNTATLNLGYTTEELNEEIPKIAKTIPSSWEFVDYTLLIEDVSRAFTHQLVRTRTASFAQQTMRMINKSDFTYTTAQSITDDKDDISKQLYHDTMRIINERYESLLEIGTKPEDARGILPTNIHTNIIMKANLRTIVELYYKRSSLRVQGEYRKFIDRMREKIEKVHPFTKVFFDRRQEKLLLDLQKEVQALIEDEERDKEDIAKSIYKLTDEIVRNEGGK